MKKLLIVLMLLGIANAQSDALDRADFKGTWPFTIEEASLWCLDGNAIAVFNYDNDKMYPLNGAAKTKAAKLMLEPSLDPIWLDDPSNKGAKMSVGKFIEMGLTECK